MRLGVVSDKRVGGTVSVVSNERVNRTASFLSNFLWDNIHDPHTSEYRANMNPVMEMLTRAYTMWLNPTGRSKHDFNAIVKKSRHTQHPVVYGHSHSGYGGGH